MSEEAGPVRRGGVRDLPGEQRPRERLLRHGARHLGADELLAILLGTGTRKQGVMELSRDLLRRYGLLGLLRAGPEELLTQVSGLGPAKVATILSAMELGFRAGREEIGGDGLVKTPRDVWNRWGPEMAALGSEQVRVISLNSRGKVIGEKTLYEGTVHGAQVRVAEVLREPIVRGATQMIMIHNHPSGDPTPSAPDLDLTNDIEIAAGHMQIEFIDHVILGASERFTSLRDKGLMKSARPRRAGLSAPDYEYEYQYANEQAAGDGDLG